MSRSISTLIEQLLEKARSGDADARKALVEKAGLRIARVAMGDSAKDKYDALREIERGEGTAPGLGALLAGIARDRDDGELRRAIELVIRAGTRRWGPPERAAIAETIERHGARLNAELAIDVLDWFVEFPDEPDAVMRGVMPALVSAHAEQVQRFAWSRGFQALVISPLFRTPDVKLPPSIVMKALFGAQSHGTSSVAAIERIWERTEDRRALVAAIDEQVRGNYGMSGRDEIVDWSWRRFCSHEREREELYRAFERWRDLWIEKRNAMPAHARPGGGSAVAHLKLWAGLSVEHLSSVVEEVKRFARDDEWPALVDLTFDLGTAAPLEWRRHGLAGVCRIAGDVCNRIREGATQPGINEAADRVIARGEALARELRETGAVIDEIVANRANDLDNEARLIREKRDRDAQHAADAAARLAESARRAAEIEEARLRAEAARVAAEEARIRAEAEMRARVSAALPRFMPQPIDEEVFFSSLPAPTLISYARMFKTLTQGGSIQALGISLEMVTVVNQTWSSLFAQRPELAMRFSVLISSPL